MRSLLDRLVAPGLAVVLVFGAAWLPTPSVAQDATGPAAPIVRTGTVVASLNVAFVVAPPSGSTVSCSVALVSNDVHAPSDSKAVEAAVSGATAHCSLSVSYRWALASATSAMTIFYTVSGPAQASSALYGTITVPPSGTTTPVNIAVTQ
jgi:hypothetical protein